MLLIGPMVDIFGEIERAFNKQLCMVNPIEATAEGIERGLEWAAQAAEDTAEWFSGWKRRRRAIGGRRIAKDVFLSRNEASDFLLNRVTRSNKASDICFSIRGQYL